MAILHTSGTKLELSPTKPLAKSMLWAVGLLLLVGLFFPSFSDFGVNYSYFSHQGVGILLPFNAAIWIVTSLCIGIGLYSTARTYQYSFQPLHLAFLIAACLITIPIFYHQANAGYALFRILAIWFSLLFLISLRQVQWTSRQHNQLIFLICNVIFIKVIQGYILYFSYDLDYFLNKFQHINVLSSLLTLSLILSAYLLTQLKKNPWTQFLLTFIPILILPMFFLINAFIGWLSLFISVLLIQPYLFRYLSLNRWLHWFFCLLIGFSIGVFLAATEYSFWDRFINNISFDSLQLLSQLKDMLFERPLTGYGYAQFESTYIVYTATQHYLDPAYSAGIPSLIKPMNEWMYWWVEGGLLAFIGLFSLLLFCLYQLKKVTKAKKLLMLAILLPLILHSAIISPFYYSNLHWLLLVILIYWFNYKVNPKASIINVPKKGKKSLKSIAIIIPIVTLLIMGSAIQAHSFIKSIYQNQPIENNWFNFYPKIWQEKIELANAEQDLQQDDSNQNHWQNYLHWQLEHIKRHPTPENYSHLLFTYQQLAMTAQQQATQQEANFLFPDRQVTPYLWQLNSN